MLGRTSIVTHGEKMKMHNLALVALSFALPFAWTTATAAGKDIKEKERIAKNLVVNTLKDVTPGVNTGTEEIILTGHGLQNDDELVFDNFKGNLPSGIKDNTSYYALVTSEDAFKITKTKGDYDNCVNLQSGGGANWRVRKAELSSWLKGSPSASPITHTITLTNHGLTSVDSNKNNVAVEFGVDASALLPGGLAAGTTYYVKYIDT